MVISNLLWHLEQWVQASDDEVSKLFLWKWNKLFSPFSEVPVSLEVPDLISSIWFSNLWICFITIFKILKYLVFFLIILSHPIKLIFMKLKNKLASCHSLLVTTDDSWRRCCWFKPLLRSPFFTHHSFGPKVWSKKR